MQAELEDEMEHLFNMLHFSIDLGVNHTDVLELVNKYWRFGVFIQYWLIFTDPTHCYHYSLDPRTSSWYFGSISSIREKRYWWNHKPKNHGTKNGQLLHCVNATVGKYLFSLSNISVAHYPAGCAILSRAFAKFPWSSCKKGSLHFLCLALKCAVFHMPVFLTSNLADHWPGTRTIFYFTSVPRTQSFPGHFCTVTDTHTCWCIQNPESIQKCQTRAICPQICLEFFFTVFIYNSD